MKWIPMVLVTALCFGSGVSLSQTKKEQMKTEKEIKNVIETFVRAGEERNVSMYEGILHPEFRVIANRYPTADKTSILRAEDYVGLIAKKVIGGTKYWIRYSSIDVAEHSATVRAELRAEKGGQWVTFLLILSPENKWQIIADMAVQTE